MMTKANLRMSEQRKKNDLLKDMYKTMWHRDGHRARHQQAQLAESRSRRCG